MAPSLTLGRPFRWIPALPFAAVLIGVTTSTVAAQAVGQIRGVVTRVSDKAPLQDVLVILMGINRRVSTRVDGRYTLNDVPLGHQVIRFQALGYAAVKREAEVTDAAPVSVDVALEPLAVQLGDIVVEGASRTAEKVLDAPSALSVVTPSAARAAAMTGQMPLAFTAMPGVDVVQGDLQDFKVNTRGFNTPTARSVLVLQDGRDVSIPFLGLQQWAALSMPPDDMAAIEFIRGPGSALYGANAFAGVINMITPEARDVVGTKIRVVAGELGTRQGDLRHAGLLAANRLGYRVNVGYSRSASWSRSRTRYDGQDFIQEYAPATDSAVGPPGPERIPLNGQTRDPITGGAVGTPEDLISMYGTARIDWYAANGTVATFDAGAARVQNGLAVVGSGRIQVIDHIRPWTRIAWSAPKYSLTAWYSGSNTLEPQVLLSSGARQEDASGLFHGEAQYHTTLFQDRARVVVGTSLRQARINTKGTLLDSERDDRHDLFYGAYGHVEYAVLPRLLLIGGLRWDKNDLFDAEVTPRVGLLFRPNTLHAIRLTLNRAFLVPSYAELFLRLQPPARNLSTLEANLRDSPVGPALAGVPEGELFTNSAAVPTLVLGNPDLVPQTVTSFELGYRGQVSRHVFATFDTYFDRKSNFVTALLPAPAVNPKFQQWTAPSGVPLTERQAVESAVRDSLVKSNGAALTRVQDASTAFVLSFGNAGLVHEWGVEIGLVGQLTTEIRLSGGYAFYDFDIKRQQQGDVLQPNTPRHKGTVSLGYEGNSGIDLEVSSRFVEGYRWAAGVFQGYIPSMVTTDLSADYRLSVNIRLQALATNVLNNRHFEVYGGSVQGRRILGGVTANF
jgi:outer membrane receptor for ferrienterochelin and colicins